MPGYLSCKISAFGGDILKWAEFHDMFRSTVHNHKGLSDVEKLTYLREHLSGVALDAISGLQIDDANYSVALQLLCERFGDPQALIT